MDEPFEDARVCACCGEACTMTPADWEAFHEDMAAMAEEAKHAVLTCEKHGEYVEAEGCLDCMYEWSIRNDERNVGV